jgi:CRISPR-associated protein Cas1
MTERILDISDRPARLSVRNDLLVIDIGPSPRAPLPPVAGEGGSPEAGRVSAARDPDSGLRARDSQAQTVPLADLAVLVVSHPQVSFTHAVLAGLAAAGGIFIACNEKHLPAAMMLPLETHSTQAERFSKQAAAPVPLRKRAWQQIVQAKVRAQARLLEERTGKDWGLGAMSGQVRSGDQGNLEARAARVYWQALFGEHDFRRDPEGEGLNPLLNYGYAIVRAIVARALCAAGLHPSLGVHHHNRYDAFCLADDLMEPFRPLADRVVARLADGSAGGSPADTAGTAVPLLDRDSKRAILEGLLGRFTADDESRTLFDWAGRAAASLAAVIEGREEKLHLPLLAPDARILTSDS